MTDGFSGAESALSLSQSKAEHVRHSYSYDFRALTRLFGKGDVLCVLKTHSLWVYYLAVVWRARKLSHGRSFEHRSRGLDGLSTVNE